MSEQNKETVKKVNEALQNGKTEVFLDAMAENVEWHIMGEKPVKGLDAIRQFMKSMDEQNKDVPKFTVIDPVIADGDYVVARGDMTMKDKDGQVGDYAYCDIYRFSGDKIAELTTFVVKTEAKGKSSSAA